MTDPVTPVANPLPVQPVERSAPTRSAAAQPGEAHPVAKPAPERRPLTVDVQRGDAGVFVYTLRDPATDTVLAVIPREAVRSDRDGRHLDQLA